MARTLLTQVAKQICPYDISLHSHQVCVPWHGHHELPAPHQLPPDLCNVSTHHSVCVQVDSPTKPGEEGVELEASKVGWAGKVSNILWS